MAAMKSQERQYFIKKALLSIWGMATLVLFFCVLILVYEMLEKGQNPLVIKPRKEFNLASQKPQRESSAPAREVTLYFASPDGLNLVPERHVIEYSEYTVENCRKAIEAIITGPKDILLGIVSPETKVRGVYMLDGGELIVDLSGDTITGLTKSVSAEALMLYGIVNALAQEEIAGIKQGTVNTVRFLIEGSLPEEYLPAEPRHIDMSTPFLPDHSWLLTAEGEFANV